ncbi:MAG TPA: multicopper oxidase domain-containing protein [Terracidiphilus sp.]|nr:multicopper oxidase domain-containing protein [Terracidiphilus sp.]
MRKGSLAAALLTARRGWEQEVTAHRMPAPQPKSAAKTLDSTKLASFVDPLLLPVLQKPLDRRSSAVHGATDAPYYAVHIRAIHSKLHRDLPPSQLWGYGATSAPVLFEEHRGRGVLIDWFNDLPGRQFLPFIPPPNGMKPGPPTRAVTHVHGARVPSISDGYPEDWFVPGQHKLCYYPNEQEAASLWVHDHAIGMNRLNIYAGLMGWYLIRDDVEQSLGLPAGKYELPLLLYDRSFDPAGQLYYPNPPDEGAWAQEFLGDAMMVNGKVRPYHDVEPRKYRLRLANTANSRFFSLSLSNGQSFHIIGSDQGFLASPVEMSRLVIAPAERADIIVDFREARGQNIVLQSDGLELMQFRVGKNLVDDPSQLPKSIRPIERIPESRAVRTRLMTLNEFDNADGMAMVMLLNRKHWMEPLTERVKLNSAEIWSMANLTQDTHPMHLHLVRFQILDRRSFSVDDYLATDTQPLSYTGPAIEPAAHEMGWKDVVQCPPGMVTRIIVPFQGYTGRYVWHCHILEHEANDMMRPYEVV